MFRKATLRDGATCAHKRETAAFWLWFWRSDFVLNTAERLGFGVLPPRLRKTITERFMQVVCGVAELPCRSESVTASAIDRPPLIREHRCPRVAQAKGTVIHLFCGIRRENGTQTAGNFARLGVIFRTDLVQRSQQLRAPSCATDAHTSIPTHNTHKRLRSCTNNNTRHAYSAV